MKRTFKIGPFLPAALAAAAGTVWLVWQTRGSLWLLPAAAGLLLAAWKA